MAAKHNFNSSVKDFVQTNLGGDQRTNLVNLFNDYTQANPEQKNGFWETLWPCSVKKKRTFPLKEAKSKVVAAVREQALFSFTTHWSELEGRKTEPKIASEPIFAWFARCLVLDFAEYVSMVSPENLKAWGVSFDELFETTLFMMSGTALRTSKEASIRDSRSVPFHEGVSLLSRCVNARAYRKVKIG